VRTFSQPTAHVRSSPFQPSRAKMTRRFPSGRRPRAYVLTRPMSSSHIAANHLHSASVLVLNFLLVEKKRDRSCVRTWLWSFSPLFLLLDLAERSDTDAHSARAPRSWNLGESATVGPRAPRRTATPYRVGRNGTCGSDRPSWTGPRYFPSAWDVWSSPPAQRHFDH
jgi:hypothetical protein